MGSLKVDRNKNKSFDYVINSLLAYSLISAGLNSYVGSSIQPEDEIALGGNPNVSNLALSFKPFTIVDPVFRGDWPQQLIIKVDSLPNGANINTHPKIPQEHVIKGAGYALGFNIMSSFVSFFESIKDEIEKRFGSNPYQWPSQLNFSRVVRNAFSHKGVINFTNVNANSVTWKSLTYAPSDNGRQILFKDLSCVEILLLMIEIDNVLT